MNLLFCHDGPIQVDENNVMYPQNFTDEVVSRYFTIADNITFLMRTVKFDPKKTNKKPLNMKNLKIVDFPNLASVKGFTKVFKAKKLVEEYVKNCDYLVARLPSLSGFMAVDYAKKLRKPYLVELVACPWDAFWNHSIKGKLMAPYMYFKTKSKVKNAPYVVYVTSEFLQKRYPTKGKNTNCSDVLLKDFDDNILQKRLDKIENKSAEEKIIIGTTAAVDVKYKGQQYVIKALGELKKKGITNYEYQLVGGGNQEYLRNIAKKYGVTEQVKFLGSLPHDMVFSWLDGIDIYVQPSRQEGLPRALIEAMSRGLPAFGATTGGIPELLDDEFIFSNTQNNINEICDILSKFDKETMKNQAIKNFNMSKNYKKDIIEARRKDFFKDFKTNPR